MIVKVRVMYRFGGWNQLSFEKSFEMTSAPNKDIDIYETDGEGENWVKLRDHESQFNDETTHILFTPNSDEHEFYIEKETYWKRPVRGDVVDHILETFQRFGWERKDNTNPEVMKELMSKHTSY